MNRYRLSLTDKQVKEALDDYVQRVLYPNHTTGGVVYFSHDVITGETLVELAYPLPDNDSDPEENWDRIEGAAV